MTLTEWSKKLGRPILAPGDVTDERKSNGESGTPPSKPRKSRPDPRYKAQYRYQAECVECRRWMRDNNPAQFRKICWKVGRRRPTYRIFKKRKKEAVHNGTTSKETSGSSGT